MSASKYTQWDLHDQAKQARRIVRSRGLTPLGGPRDWIIEITAHNTTRICVPWIAGKTTGGEEPEAGEDCVTGEYRVLL